MATHLQASWKIHGSCCVLRVMCVLTVVKQPGGDEKSTWHVLIEILVQTISVHHLKHFATSTSICTSLIRLRGSAPDGSQAFTLLGEHGEQPLALTTGRECSSSGW